MPTRRPFRLAHLVCSVAAVLALLAVSPSPSHAGTVRSWFGAHGSLATYSMSDVNEDIGGINEQIAGSGLSMDEIHGGLGLGAAFGIELPSRLSLGIAYDRLPASTDVGDATGSVEYNFPANAFRALVVQSFASGGPVNAHVGASLGIVNEAGSVRFSVAGGGSLTGDISGSSPMFEAFTGGDWWAAPQFAITGSVGYRYAKISEAKVEGEIIYKPNGEKMSIDYSGVFVRMGLKVAIR